MHPGTQRWNPVAAYSPPPARRLRPAAVIAIALAILALGTAVLYGVLKTWSDDAKLPALTKKQAVGTWATGTTTVSILPDGRFATRGLDPTVFAGCAKGAEPDRWRLVDRQPSEAPSRDPGEVILLQFRGPTSTSSCFATLAGVRRHGNLDLCDAEDLDARCADGLYLERRPAG